MTKRALTLIELLVVLLILGALVTFSIEGYTDSQKKSRVQVFENNIGGITKALTTYKSNSIIHGE